MDDGTREYLRGLQASIESQEATIQSLQSKNKRLEEKLKNSESYSEELRVQVETLSQEVTSLKNENKRLERIQSHKEKDPDPPSIESQANNDNAVSVAEITQAAQEVKYIFQFYSCLNRIPIRTSFCMKVLYFMFSKCFKKFRMFKMPILSKSYSHF